MHNNNAPSTLYHAIAAIAARQPDHTAIIFGEDRYTYSQLMERTKAAAEYLRMRGARHGDTVAVFSQNRPEVLFCFYAAASLGAVFVPLNFNLTPDEVSYILIHSDAKLLLRDDLVADLTSLSLPRGYVHDISDIFASNAPQENVQVSDVRPSDDLLISYTSGSTGVPKAVVLDHKSQLNAAASFAELWGISSKDTTVLGAPLGFLLGLSTISTVSILSGSTLVIKRRFHPGEILSALVENRATIFNGVPTMFSMMLDFAQEKGELFDLSGMRAIISSGSSLPTELRTRFAQAFGKELQDYFGMTEAYPLFGHYANDAETTPPDAAGKIVPGAGLRVVDQNGDECPTGAPGELLVKAPSMLKRYHKDPGLTEASFRDEWFMTGDIGLIDEKGYVYITGRLKDLIKRGGANVAPAEIEAALLRHPAIRASAVVGTHDSFFGEVPVAFVVKAPDAEITEEQLLAFAATVLAKFKVPSHLHFLNELPLGKTGKVDKNCLRRILHGLSTSAVPSS